MTELRVSEAEVRAVVEPEFTKSWHPVSHAKVLDALTTAAENHGLAIKSKNYTLANKGSKLFGTWNIDSGHTDRDWTFGFRNGLDKSMALGMTAGTTILVCANMCFSGDYIAFRKHTSGLTMDQLVWMADKAIAATIEKARDFDAWHQNLKEKELTVLRAKAFMFDCLKEGVLPPSKFKEFIEATVEEYNISKARSVYTYHGGVTRVLRDTSLFNIADRTRKLTAVCDHYMAEAA